MSTVALRYRALKTEYDTLDRADDRREKKRYDHRQPTSPGKKRRLNPDLEQKQSKNNKESKQLSTSQIKTTKIKKETNTVSSPAPSQQTDDSMDGMTQKDNQKLVLPKNDTPNRFWLSVEPYCMPLTQEDIKLLDDLIDDYSDQLVPPIPELGPHYSTRWANDDIRDEQDNSNTNSKNKSRNNPGQPVNGEVIGLLRKGEKLMGENITGPLTQRLVSALMEQNLISDTNSTTTGNQGVENKPGIRQPVNSLMKNGIEIERRVREELIEHGLLDPDDFTKGNNNDDEILSEIKRVGTELSAISEYNCNELRRLYTVAKEEMKRLEMKRKLDAIDQDVSWNL